MNINELQPRVFHNGKLSKIDKIIFENDGILREGIGFFEEGEYGCKHHVYLYFDTDNFEIDRPVCTITDRNGKEVVLYEHDIIEVENEEKPGEKSRHVVEWGGNWNPLRSFKRLTFALVPQFYDEKELSIDLSMVLFSGIMRIGIIGNVHENHELANEVWPEGWERYRNANP